MPLPRHPTQIRRSLGARLKKLAPAGPVLAASLTKIAKRCGSLKNMAQRLLDSLRYLPWPDDASDAQQAAAMQIRRDSS